MPEQQQLPLPPHCWSFSYKECIIRSNKPRLSICINFVLFKHIGAGSGPAGPSMAGHFRANYNYITNIHKCIYNIYVYSCEIQGTLQDQLVSTTNPSSMYYVHARTRTSLLPRSDATCNALYGVMAQPDLVLPDSGLAQTNSYIWQLVIPCMWTSKYNTMCHQSTTAWPFQICFRRPCCSALWSKYRPLRHKIISQLHVSRRQAIKGARQSWQLALLRFSPFSVQLYTRDGHDYRKCWL